uniref:Uncharacterized protein n=1 Tax=Eutreptiella gymnastica TaxID=73025 RepID=A0A7S1J1E1_9EUGL
MRCVWAIPRCGNHQNRGSGARKSSLGVAVRATLVTNANSNEEEEGGFSLLVGKILQTHGGMSQPRQTRRSTLKPHPPPGRHQRDDGDSAEDSTSRLRPYHLRCTQTATPCQNVGGRSTGALAQELESALII